MEKKNTKKKAIIICSIVAVVILSIIIICVCMNRGEAKYDYIHNKISQIHSEGLQDNYKNIVLVANETDFILQISEEKSLYDYRVYEMNYTTMTFCMKCYSSKKTLTDKDLLNKFVTKIDENDNIKSFSATSYIDGKIAILNYKKSDKIWEQNAEMVSGKLNYLKQFCQDEKGKEIKIKNKTIEQLKKEKVTD